MVAVGGRVVPEQVWRTSKAAVLAKLLALAPGHRLHREQAIEVLWPELGRDAAAANLRKAVHYARRAVGADGAIVSVIEPEVSTIGRRAAPGSARLALTRRVIRRVGADRCSTCTRRPTPVAFVGDYQGLDSQGGIFRTLFTLARPGSDTGSPDHNAMDE